MKFLILACFVILFLAGCDTGREKVLAPTTSATSTQTQSGADGDGTVVKTLPMPGPLLPGQARPIYTIGDPDASGAIAPIQKGDPTSDD